MVYELAKAKITREQLLSELEDGLLPRDIATKYLMKVGSVRDRLVQEHLPTRFETFKINLISSDRAKCRLCKLIKPLDQFPSQHLSGNKISHCVTCRSIKVNTKWNSDIKSNFSGRYWRLKDKAAKIGCSFNLTLDDLIDQFNHQNGKCFYTDIDLDYRYGVGHNRNGLSIDKIIPELGYVKGNVVFCSFRVNSAKCDFSLEEMKKWMPEWYGRIIKFNSQLLS